MLKGKPIKRSIRQVTHADIVEGVLGVEQTINTLKTLESNLVERLDTKLKEVDDVLEPVVADLQQAVESIEQMKEEALDLIADIKQGEKGDDADEDAIEERVLARIPKLDIEAISNLILSRVPKLDEKKLKNDILSLVPRKSELKVVQERVEVDPMSVLEKIMELPEEKRKGLKMKVENIDGLSQTISAMQSQLGKGYLHGGGISNITGLVTAGTNVTITGSGTSSSPYVINSSGGGGSGWGLTGNAGTTAGTNFIGTTDDIDVVLKRNSVEVIRLPTGSTSSDTYTQFNGSNSANFLDSTGNTFIQRIISGDINIVNGGGASQLTVGTASIQLSPDTYAELTSTKPFRYSTSGGYVALKAPASVAASFTLTLPNTDSTGTQALVSDGAGTLSWSSIGGGTPGGSNTQVQYNNAGSFAGISGATTNGTVMTLTSPIVATSQTNSYATASTIGIFDGSKNLISADTATYPSLTELSYVKGATSSIQTQLGTKQTTGTDITLAENTSIILDPVLSADGKYTGITRTGTAGTTLAFGDLCYLDPTDSRWELVDANSAQGADGDARGVVGMCVLAAAGDGSATNILLYGTIRADTAFPAMTVNNQMYVSETAGDITGTQPSTSGVVIRVVGVALTADELLFNPSPDYITHA